MTLSLIGQTWPYIFNLFYRLNIKYPIFFVVFVSFYRLRKHPQDVSAPYLIRCTICAVPADGGALDHTARIRAAIHICSTGVGQFGVGTSRALDHVVEADAPIG